jgi:hypothetical protein
MNIYVYGDDIIDCNEHTRIVQQGVRVECDGGIGIAYPAFGICLLVERLYHKGKVAILIWNQMFNLAARLCGNVLPAA